MSHVTHQGGNAHTHTHVHTHILASARVCVCWYMSVRMCVCVCVCVFVCECVVFILFITNSVHKARIAGTDADRTYRLISSPRHVCYCQKRKEGDGSEGKKDDRVRSKIGGGKESLVIAT